MQIDIKLLPFQHQALMAPNRTVCLSCGVASGKTATAALLAIIHMMQGKRVLVIEPTYTQLKDVFFSEVETQLYRYGIVPEGKKVWNLNSKCLKFMSGTIFCRSAEGGKSAIAGLTAIDTVIIDECSEIDDPQIFTESKNRQRKCKFPDQKKIFCVGTAAAGEHWFKQVSMKPNTLLINACYKDNFFLNEEDIQDYDEEYGENSIWPKAYIEQFVFGKFVDASEASLFTDVIIDAPPKKGVKTAGYDIAYSGKGDNSVITVRDGNIIEAVYAKKTKGDEEIKAFQQQIDLIHKPDYWFYDATGNGLILKGVPINFAEAGGMFANMRTKIYFDLKRDLKEGLHLPANIKNQHWAIIKQELDATSLKLEKETKKPILIPKEDIKKHIGRSPDYADSLALSSIPPANANLDHNKLNQQLRQGNPFNANRR